MTPSTTSDAAVAPSDGPVFPVVPVVLEREIDDEPAAPAADAGPADNVRLQLRVGPVDAEVTWGAKRLGLVKRSEPLEILRPRHSGPVDLVIRAPGFVPYHTRLFTDADDRISVDLVRPSAGIGLVQWKPKGPVARPSRR